MKKYLKTCLLAVAAFVLCLLVFPTTAKAASVDDLTFVKHYQGILYNVTGCDPDASGDLVIPETYEGLPVAWINYEAFANCDKLTSVTIPDSVTEIGMGAFSGCDSLKSVTIGNGVEIIDWRVFSGCSSLTDITFGNKVNTISSEAFSHCTGLKQITIPDSVAVIHDKAFQGCTGLTDIDFGSGLTSIGQLAFARCTGLTAVKLPDSVTSVGGHLFEGCTGLQSIHTGNGLSAISTGMFSGCSSLTDVKIGSGVNTIGTYAFENCTGLQGLTFPDNVTAFEGWSFEGCTSLRSIALGKTITSIAEYTFANCYGLESITIPDSVTSIGYQAFEYCTNLKRINIGKGVTSIGYWVVSECPNLKEVHISDLAAWCKIDFDGSGANPLSVGADLYLDGRKVTKLVIPGDVTVIGDYAFEGCRSITSVIIPDNVTDMGAYTFYDNYNLTDVIIGSGVNTIKSYVFTGCPDLTNLVLPDTVTNIESYAAENLSSNTAIWYLGSKAQKERITIGWCNYNLTSGNWHYQVTVSMQEDRLVFQCGECAESFEMDISEPPAEEIPEVKFEDISQTSWQFAAAKYAVEKNLMAGKGTDADGNIKFDPNSPITREEFVQVLYNAEGKPSVDFVKDFPDVAEGGWYRNAVLWANKNNIANGLGDGSFGVGKNITRQDLALMLYKYAAMKNLDLTAPEGEIDQYADGSQVSGYAQTAMNWAVKKGVLSGKGLAGEPLSTFRLDPAGTATRAECAAMLKNFMTAFGL